MLTSYNALDSSWQVSKAVNPSNDLERRIVILGLARQGMALARFFAGVGARVIVSDRAASSGTPAQLAELARLGVETVLGDHPLTLLDQCDLLCLSGGVPMQLEVVQAAMARGIPLSNDSLLTMQVARARGLGPIIGITGSSGKTTTTTLVGEMLRAAGRRVHVGGNIGTPLIDRLDQVAPGDAIVLELSSFQLELFDPSMAYGALAGVGPDVMAVLNITPNHLDRHGTMAAYAAAKLTILRHLPAGATLVVCADDPVTAQLLPDAGDAPAGVVRQVPGDWHLDDLLADARNALVDADVNVRPFSQRITPAQGAWRTGDRLVYQGEDICRVDEVLLRGEHNVSNLLAAMVVSGAAGAEPEAMATVARSFAGVPHRLEVVAQRDRVTWINDSIATSPERAIAALRSFDPAHQTIVLLAGGKDKNLPWQEFADEVIARVTMLVGFGDAGAMVVRTVQERAELTRRAAPSCAVVQRLDEAVELVRRSVGPDTVVLLSPGGTSYDTYRDFEERGEHFRRLVLGAGAENPSDSRPTHRSW